MKKVLAATCFILFSALQLSSAAFAQTAPELKPNFKRGVFGVFQDAALNDHIYRLLEKAHRASPWKDPSDIVMFNLYIQTDPNSGLAFFPSGANVQLLAVGADLQAAEIQHVYQGDFKATVSSYDKSRSLRIWVKVDSNGTYVFQHRDLVAAEKFDVILRKKFDLLRAKQTPVVGHILILRSMDQSVRIAPRLNNGWVSSWPWKSAIPGSHEGGLTMPDIEIGPTFDNNDKEWLEDFLGRHAPSGITGVSGGGSGLPTNSSGTILIPNGGRSGGTPTVTYDDGADGTADAKSVISIEGAGGGGGNSSIKSRQQRK